MQPNPFAVFLAIVLFMAVYGSLSWLALTLLPYTLGASAGCFIVLAVYAWRNK